MKPVVVHVITGLKTGGAEQMLFRLVSGTAAPHFDHRVICLTDEGPVADQIRSSGVPVQNLGMTRGLPNPLAIRRLAGMLREHNASVVQTWLYHADLIGGLAARMAGIPVAWGIHHSRLDPESTGRSLRMTVRACSAISGRVPQAIVCCAEASRDAHIDHGYPRHKIIVIPNGFDTSTFKPDPRARADIRRELGVADNDRIVGIAGRFVPLKNHRLFIDAASRVARVDPDVTFVMAGEELDETNAELQAWINASGLAGRIQLLGQRNDMHRLLAFFDICALTSRTEAFPLVIGEAMASGVPCVSTDVGDAAYLIADTGRVVSSDDAVAFAAALNELLAMEPNQRQELGAAARQRMIEHFDIGKIGARYEYLWCGMITDKSACA